MQKMTPTQKLYPKPHLLAASGLAALLCLSLLVYPSREVEAKKTFINIELEEQSLEQVTQDPETDLHVLTDEIMTGKDNSALSQNNNDDFQYKKNINSK